MNLPKVSMENVGWAELISITAWVCTVVYVVAVVRSDVNSLKQLKEDHEARLRVVERVGSEGLRAHISMDDERQKNLEQEVIRQRQEVMQIRETLARVDANVSMLLANTKR